MQKKNKLCIGTIIILIMSIVICMLTGCSVPANKNTSTAKATTSVDIYFVEKQTSRIKSEKRDILGEEKKDIISNVVNELKGGPSNDTYINAVPKTVEFKSMSLDGKTVSVDVSSDYKNMKSGEELLCRAAIVYTLTGIEFIESVEITVDGTPLQKTNGEPMGALSREDIVIDGVISPEPIHWENVKLYFCNENASGLATEMREIEVNPNQPLEKYILEQLIAGPKDEGHFATIPSETKIRDIKTADGICYVDLSAEFVSKHSGGSTGEALTIYSIVNSLCELQDIDGVQFLIEGEKQNEFKGHIDFGKPFKANYSLSV